MKKSIIAMVLIIGLGAGGWYYWNNIPMDMDLIDESIEDYFDDEIIMEDIEDLEVSIEETIENQEVEVPNQPTLPNSTKPENVNIASCNWQVFLEKFWQIVFHRNFQISPCTASCNLSYNYYP